VIRSEEARVGMKVEIREGYGPQEFQGCLGTVEQVYGHPEHRALSVRLENGRSMLLWHYQLSSATAGN
jgi:hypothetical protein